MRKRSFLFLFGLLSVVMLLGACVPLPEPARVTARQAATVEPTVLPATSEATAVPTLAATTEVTSTVALPTAEVGTSLPPSTSVPLTATVPSTVTAAGDAQATPGEGRRITLDDNGKTVTMQVGERVLLYLGEGYTWDLSISDLNVLSRVMGVMTIRGSQGLFDAKQAGTTTITASGDPECRQSQPPCAMPSRAFQVQVVVQ